MIVVSFTTWVMMVVVVVIYTVVVIVLLVVNNVFTGVTTVLEAAMPGPLEDFRC